MPQNQCLLEPASKQRRRVQAGKSAAAPHRDEQNQPGEGTGDHRGSPEPSSRPPRGRRRRRFVRLLTCAAVLAAAAVLLWEKVLEQRFVPKRWGVVVPGAIYRSGQISKWLIEETLIEHDIGVIIDFQNFDWNDRHQQAELAVAWKHRIPVNRFVLTGDGIGDILNYAQAIAIMEDCRRNKTPCLVHCGAGSQRTGAAVAFYRILVQGWPPERACQELLDYDWNPDKDAVLLGYMNRHMGELASLLVEFDVLDRVPNPLPTIGRGPGAPVVR